MARVCDIKMPVWRGCELRKAQLALEARRQRLRDAEKVEANLRMRVRSGV
jgi:hypothetical protein